MTVRFYPKISDGHHGLALQSLIATMTNLYKNVKVFDRFVQHFVYESIIWTCSGGEHKACVKLWRGLVDVASYRDVDERRGIVRGVFDEMIKSLFVSTMKLDLGTSNEASADDYVFSNMVDFYAQVIDGTDAALFRKWIKRFARHVIARSSKHPTVAGYYKLLMADLRVASDLRYFDNACVKEDKAECFRAVLGVLLAVVGRIRECKGDLLLACVELVLRSPVAFVRSLLPTVGDVFEIVFSLGRSRVDIAIVGVETLDMWCRHVDIDEMKPLLRRILPRLDAFLRSKRYGIDIDVDATKTKKLKRRDFIETASDLWRVQSKIIDFVGRLDSEVATYLIDVGEDLEPVPWETQPSLRFTLPFPDAKLSMFLDRFVPRVIELAASSGDRNTRVHASEVLYGTVVVLLGTSRQMNVSKYKTHSRLFETTVKAIVELGCDSDQLIRDIFEELARQVVHWVTSPAMQGRPEPDTVMDVLMESVCHASNSSLRDFSGSCIDEFVKWSISQYDKTDSLNIHANVRKVVKKICAFCTHPSREKRIGAAVAFNHVYATIREEESMVDIFWIDVLYSFVLSLESTDCDAVSEAIDHVERVFREKRALFSGNGNKRSVPGAISGPQLKHVLVWVLHRTGGGSVRCREKCRWFFESLCTAVESSPREFVEKHVPDAQWYRTAYETDDIDSHEWIVSRGIVSIDAIEIAPGDSKKLFELISHAYENSPDYQPPFDAWQLLCKRVYETDDDLAPTLDRLHDVVPASVADEIRTGFSEYFDANYKGFENETIAQRKLLKGLVAIQRTRFRIRTDRFSVASVFKAIVHDACYAYVPPQALASYELHLQLALTEEPLPALWHCLVEANEYDDYETGRKIAHGSYFFNKFDVITKYLTENAAEMMRVFFASPGDGYDIVTSVIENVAKNRRNAPRNDDLFRNANAYFVHEKNDSLQELERKVALLTNLARVSKRPVFSNALKNWFVLTLLRNDFTAVPRNLLDFKMKALGLVPCFEDDAPLLSTLQELLKQLDGLDARDAAFRRLLGVLARSRSLMVLRCAFDAFERADAKIDESIATYFRNTTVEHQSRSLSLLLEAIGNREYSCEKRYALMKAFSYAMLRRCDYAAFEAFYVTIVDDIRAVLRQAPTAESFLRKSTRFVLVEILFSRVDTGKLKACTCPISRKLLGNALVENGLLKELCGYAKAVRKETHGANDERYRLYQANAFNALVSMIANTKTEPADLRAYDYIFAENVARNDYVWERIVDCNRTIGFDECFDSIPGTTRAGSSVRKLGAATLRPRAIFSSSLSEDVTRYDFSGAALRDEPADVPVDPFQAVVVESVDLNDHECMGAICGMLQHLIDRRIVASDSTPSFVEAMRKRLSDGATGTNVKIFLCRVILNMPGLFGWYSESLLVPIVRSVVEGTFGRSLNYFVVDLLTVMTGWDGHGVLARETSLVNELVAFLIRHAHHDRRDVLIHNLNVVQAVISAWKNYVTTPTTLLETLKSERKQTGIQLVAIFLANDVLVWSRTTVNAFLASLATIIRADKTFNKIQKSASEVVGMTLKIMSGRPEWRTEFERLEKQVHAMLDKCEDAKFVNCLEHVQIHYPKIIERYVTEIRVKMTQNCQNATLVAICLKNLLRFAETSEAVPHLEIEHVALLSGESDVALLDLRLLNALGKKSKGCDARVLRAVRKHANSTSVEMRRAAYDVLATHDPETYRGVLLLGLADPDDVLAATARKLWSDLPDSARERFGQIVSRMYAPESESHFLAYATDFLLELCEKSEDYHKPLFEHALSECRYEEQRLSVDWKSQHTMTFAAPFEHNRPKFHGIRQESTGDFEPTQAKSLTRSVSSFLFSTVPIDEPTNSPIENVVERKTFVRHNRRFLRNPAKIREHFASQEVRRQRNRSSLIRERVKSRDLNVALYRKYRKGDFPDVVVPGSSIIEPLRALAKRDEIIARLVFVTIYENLFDDADFDIETILRASTEFNPNFTSAMFDIALRSRRAIDPSVIVSAGKNSGLVSTATLLLEEHVNDAPPRAKQSKRENETWPKLAELYSENEEHDVITGIYGKKIGNVEVIDAIRAESEQLWSKAADVYEKLVETDPHAYYREALYRCYAEMGEWKRIEDDIAIDVSLHGFQKRERLLSWLFAAGVHQMLESKSSGVLARSLDAWMSDPSKAEYIENHFSGHLSVVALNRDDARSARYYANGFVANFLQSWSVTNPLFHHVRSKCIKELRGMYEIIAYLDAIRDMTSLDADEKIGRVIAGWGSQRNVTETETVHRRFVTKLLKRHTEDGAILAAIDSARTRATFDLIRRSVGAKKYHLAEKYFAKVRNVTPGRGRDGMELSLLKCENVLLGCEQGIVRPEECLKMWRHLKECSEVTPEVACVFHRFAGAVEPVAGHESEIAKLTCHAGIRRYRADVLRKCSGHDEAYVRLVEYLRSLDGEDVGEEIISCVLKATNRGSRKARQLLPFLLRLIDRSEANGSAFRKESADVPTWMFIPWIPQLLAMLGLKTVSVVENVLHRLAESYPQAIMFAFQISKETADNDVVRSLERKLSNGLVDVFVRSLSALCLPSVNFNYHVRKLKKSAGDRASFYAAVDHFRGDFLKKVVEASKSPDAAVGPVFSHLKDPVSRYDQVITKVLNEVGVAKPEALRKKLESDIAERLESVRRSTALKDYSPWLANFQECGLEVPGQYLADRKPLPQHHVKIGSFSGTVSIFSNSQSRPFRLTMYGNDARSYGFLAKFGEDLRQDERIRQLFKVMNDALSNDPVCSGKKLRVETYAVVPMRRDVGLIEFVADTKTLSSFLFDPYEEVARKRYEDVHDSYIKWISSAPNPRRLDRSKLPVLYHNATASRTRTDTIAKFRQFVNAVPASIVKNALRNLCVDTESYVLLRKRFIESYATMCIANWVLGIGDRHLDNILVNSRMARVVGIDFGYAFEIATRNLPVPELIPFRLTPHLLSVMEPLFEIGYVDGTMRNVLRALRNEKDVITSTMDVFINEPSVEWMQCARVKAEKQRQDILDAFVPSEKVSLAERKLSGCNPVGVVLEELARGALKDDPVSLNAYRDVAKGYAEHNRRSRLSNDGLSVEEQVECLIDQATDYNILGRSWHGLKTWI